jgi:hypothetical protein
MRFGVIDLAVVRPGVGVAVLEISRGGALVESAAPIRPGARTELTLEAPSGRRWLVGARVLRCWVTALDPLRYRCAMQFDDGAPRG